MKYIFKIKSAASGRLLNKEHIDIKKAVRYFKSHINDSMEVAIYNDDDKLIACYKVVNGSIENVSDNFANIHGYARQFDIKDGYSVSIINNDLLISTEYFNSCTITDTYYYDYEGVGVHIDSKYANTVDNDNDKEFLSTEYDKSNDTIMRESTIVINRYNNKIIDVYFFNKEYNTPENKQKVINEYYKTHKPIAKYSVCRNHYIIVDTFNNKDDAIAYAKELTAKKEVVKNTYSVKDINGDIIKTLE